MRGKRKNKLQNDDWKQWKKGWPYKGLDDPKYIKERNKTFEENGNGWWRKPVRVEKTVTRRKDAVS